MSEFQVCSHNVADGSMYRKNPPPFLAAGARLLGSSVESTATNWHQVSAAANYDDALVDFQLPILNEDLAPLNPILHTIGMVAGYAAEGEAKFRPLPSAGRSDSAWDSDAAASLNPMIPLRHPDGRYNGHLGVIRYENEPDDFINLVLKAALMLAGKNIEERWFRLRHHQRWIIAAAPISDPRKSVLLAIDQRLALQGMDGHAVELFGASTGRWEDCFRPVSPLPTLRARTDIPLRLIAARDGEIWNALLTGPAFNTRTNSHDALLHARPRWHGLADFKKNEPDTSLQIPSLTPGMRRKIEEYVEAHLEVELSVVRLAEAAGMSCSHFTRAFRNVLKMTPHRYVMWRRLIRAQELIRSCDSSLAEIALVTGFSDQSHLCRIFQLHMGETPSRYRRRCR